MGLTPIVWIAAAAAGAVWVVVAAVGSGLGPETLQPRDLVPWLGLASVAFSAALWQAARGATQRVILLTGRLGSVVTIVGALTIVAASATAFGATEPVVRQAAAGAAPSVSPASSPSPVAIPDAATDPRCGSIQALVQAAEPGSTVVVPACVYRETVSLDRPLTLRAEPGAEIRGSDIWDAWTRSDDGWVSNEAAPAVDERGVCAPGTTRCTIAQQVFLDGTPLRVYEGARPPPGSFAVVGGALVLGDDPSGHIVEVSVRELWAHVIADDVTIDGFTMRHSIAPAQSGGITAGGFGADEVDRLTIRSSTLSDAHGAIVSLQGGSGHRILDSRIERGGQLGLHLSGTAGSQDWEVRGNVIADNNTADFDVGWEAGGLKALHVEGLEIRDNEFAGGPNGDNGRGAWTDTGSRDVVFTGNRSHDNGYQGALFESTHGLLVEDNVAWNNGWLGPEWAWGGGIVLSSSDHAVVRDNVVAWNADGISVVSQARDDDEPHVDILVEDNVILGVDQPSNRSAFALAWVADWAGVLFDPASANAGRDNQYWYARPEGATNRFAWNGTFRHLADFETTPGEESARYLSDAEAADILAALELPQPPGLGGLDTVWLLIQLGVGLVALGSLVGAVALAVRTRNAALLAPLALAISVIALVMFGPDGAIWPVGAFGAAWIATGSLELARTARLRSKPSHPAPQVPD